MDRHIKLLERKIQDQGARIAELEDHCRNDLRDPPPTKKVPRKRHRRKQATPPSPTTLSKRSDQSPQQTTPTTSQDLLLIPAQNLILTNRFQFLEPESDDTDSIPASPSIISPTSQVADRPVLAESVPSGNNSCKQSMQVVEKNHPTHFTCPSVLYVWGTRNATTPSQVTAAISSLGIPKSSFAVERRSTNRNGKKLWYHALLSSKETCSIIVREWTKLLKHHPWQIKQPKPSHLPTNGNKTSFLDLARYHHISP